MEVFVTNDSSHQLPTNRISKSEVQSSDNLKEILNNNNNSNQLNVENNSNFETNENILEVNPSLESKVNVKSDNIESEDNDCDYYNNDQYISDSSDEDSRNQSQPKTESSKSELLICTINNCSRYFKSYIGLRTHEAIVHQKKRNSSSNVCSDKVFSL